uniref:(northern house mosquito) hypothetical protein n=1 Tax=Culex pipiens TaxID=7175 RepID=A0A8D8PCS5_CULPI
MEGPNQFFLNRCFHFGFSLPTKYTFTVEKIRLHFSPYCIMLVVFVLLTEKKEEKKENETISSRKFIFQKINFFSKRDVLTFLSLTQFRDGKRKAALRACLRAEKEEIYI